MALCWACNKEASDQAFCAECGKIQPARLRDPFAVLGVPPRYRLDEAGLGKQYRDLSRKLHPDKFAREGARERRFSLEQTTALNEAWRTLKSPELRGTAILRLNGIAVPTDQSGVAGAGNCLPVEFYEQVMEDREALEEARAQGPEAVARLTARVTARRDASLATIDAAFTSWESSGNAGDLTPAATELAKLRYEARFLDEVAGKPHE